MLMTIVQDAATGAAASPAAADTPLGLGALLVLFVGGSLAVLAWASRVRPMNLALGFATTVAMWTFAYVALLQPGRFAGEALFAGSVACVLAGGFVAGNYLGMSLEQRLAIGSVLVRVITGRDSGQLINLLRDAGCGVTRVGAHGLQGPVEIVFTVIRRRRLGEVLTLVRRFDADAFYSIDELQASASRSTCGPRDAATLPHAAPEPAHAATPVRHAA